MFSKVNGNNATETGKMSNQPRKDSGIESVALNAAQDVSRAIFYLSLLHGRISEPLQDNDCVNFIKRIIDLRLLPSLTSLISLKDDIARIGEENPTAKNLTIMRFLCSIAENHGLYQKLKDLNDLSKNCDGTPSFANDGRFRFQLGKIVTDFKLLNLRGKVQFLELLKEKRDFTGICETYGNWYV
ncbi:MAG: hypothetical protein LBV62_03870 [Rickettsiales bacterium]|jgi:hypothetical protein|nr:hypothetical protein [Rickettsiales bacterium]